MKNILITGATGFAGYWLRKTKKEDFRIVGINRNIYENDCHWDKVRYDAIIHLAPTHPARVLECVKRNNARLLYASSGIVYHPENDTEYRRDKIAWEAECLASGADVVIARLFTFYGNKLDKYKAYTQFTELAKKNETIRISGSGDTVRSYMHGSDMAKWMWAILLRGSTLETYDVGSNDPTTIFQLAQKIQLRYGSDAGIDVEYAIPDPMPHYLPVDTEKTRKLLTT